MTKNDARRLIVSEMKPIVSNQKMADYVLTNMEKEGLIETDFDVSRMNISDIAEAYFSSRLSFCASCMMVDASTEILGACGESEDDEEIADTMFRKAFVFASNAIYKNLFEKATRRKVVAPYEYAN